MNTLFALSLFPYLAFLWWLGKAPGMPKLALQGFYLLLVFVAISIPAGLYALNHYGTSLANVDWLHGGAEAFLTLSNSVVVLGFKRALDRHLQEQNQPDPSQPNHPETVD